MKVMVQEPPRIFAVGQDKNISIRHCADINLEADEQITLVTPSGTQYDIVRKSWGYYATPSLNGRLKEYGLRAVLVRNSNDKAYLLLVENGKEADFQTYIKSEQQEIICWLDNNETIRKLSSTLTNIV